MLRFLWYGRFNMFFCLFWGIVGRTSLAIPHRCKDLSPSTSSYLFSNNVTIFSKDLKWDFHQVRFINTFCSLSCPTTPQKQRWRLFFHLDISIRISKWAAGSWNPRTSSHRLARLYLEEFGWVSWLAMVYRNGFVCLVTAARNVGHFWGFWWFLWGLVFGK